MSQSKLSKAAFLLLLYICSSTAFSASTQFEGEGIVFETVQFVCGTEGFNYSFDAEAGDYVITLTDFADQVMSASIGAFESFEVILSTATTVIGQFADFDNPTIFSIDEADTLFVSVLATSAHGQYSLFGIEVAVVPIPAALLLFVSGLFALFGYRKMA